MVTVSIAGDSHVFVTESGGFVVVCIMADHDSEASYEIVLTTSDSTATGKEWRIANVHETVTLL